MGLLLSTFKVISLIFAGSALATGAHAIFDPAGFSRTFGLPIAPLKDSQAEPYASLMGIRQFATGVVLLVFAYQGKWTEVATVLGVIGFVVAGTDGYFLSQTAGRSAALFHAIPGALIASLSWLVFFQMS